MRRVPFGASARSSGRAGRRSSKSFSARSSSSTPRACARCGVRRGRCPRAPGARGTSPRPAPRRHLRPRPPLRRAKDDRGPGGLPFRRRARCRLDGADPLPDASSVARSRRARASGRPLDEVDVVAVATEQAANRLVARPSEHRGPGDLVPVEVEHRAAPPRRAPGSGSSPPSRIPRAVRSRPRRRRRPRPREVGVVEDGAERVREHVAELAPSWIDPGVGGLTWLGTPPGVENWRKSAACPRRRAMTRVDLGVGALEVDVREHAGPPWPGPGEEDDVARPARG
jgi:hypothetical protein